jgi:NAD+ synthase (glutamine-hydrolysing)
MAWAEGEGADVLVLPELALTGYPLEDLSLREDFVSQTAEARALEGFPSASHNAMLCA